MESVRTTELDKKGEEDKMDWKDRLKGLMLETVGRVKPRPTYTTPPKPSPQQQAEIDKANYEEFIQQQKKLGKKHKKYWLDRVESEAK